MPEIEDFIQDHGELKVGHWYTRCCHLDLDQIKTESELNEFKEDSFGVEFYETKLDALFEIYQGWRDINTLNEIHAMIIKEIRESKCQK